MNPESSKQIVGSRAVDLIKSNSVVGLGTGSTVFYTIKELAKRIKEKKLKNIKAVCTSLDTEKKAKRLGIKILELNSVEKINIAIDGADEIDSNLNLIKGGGGALTREKIIDYAAEKFVVIASHEKKVEILGKFPLPVEVLKFGWKQTARSLEKLGAKVKLRVAASRKPHAANPFITDNNNYIIDAKFKYILNPWELEKIINNIPGVVQNGIFRSDKVSEVWLGTENDIEILKGKK